MKTGRLSIILCALITLVFLSSVPASGDLIVDENGNVGIGTTTPDAQLTISGAEGADGILNIWSDEGDNNADKYRFQVDAAEGWMDLEHYSRGYWTQAVRFSPEGILAIYGPEGGEAAHYFYADEGDDLDDIWKISAQDSGNLSIQSYISGGAWSNNLVIGNNGNVGIGDSTPSVRLDVAGSVRADSYIEYSKEFTGDALRILQNVQTRDSVGDWKAVSHSSLPDEVVEEYIKENSCSELYLPDGAECMDLGNGAAKVYGRNLNAMVAINRRAVVQLLERIEFLESKISQKVSSYGGWLYSNRQDIPGIGDNVAFSADPQGDDATTGMALYVENDVRMMVPGNGNFKMGTTMLGPNAATFLATYNGGAPISSPAHTIESYAKEKWIVENTREVEVGKDEALELVVVEQQDRTQIVREKVSYELRGRDVVEVKTPQYATTSVEKWRLKRDARFDPATGRFFMKVVPTREEAEAAASQQF